MAQRPVFQIQDTSPYYREVLVDFTYYTGFSILQRRRSSISLKEAYLKEYPESKVLEVSRFSDNPLGQKLSAFNLLITLDNGSHVTIENAFQSSKVFAGDVQYLDLLSVSPWEAKKDERIRQSGNLIKFRFQGKEFPLEPKTYFYDWIYINALTEAPIIGNQLLCYDAFTDIVFNPEKSINCQARTVAIYVSLQKQGLLDTALQNPMTFKDLVYGNRLPKCEQLSLFD